MKVYDCFTFFNELDLLEIRLNELNDVVDYFVLVEGQRTWQNANKSCIFNENKNKFKKFIDKIIKIEVPINKFTNNSWENEKISFNHISDGLTLASQDDVIILSPIDEIPKANVVKAILESNEFPKCILINFYQYYLNTRFDCCGSKYWHGPYIAKLHQLNKSHLYEFIKKRKNTAHVNGGWHFTFLGNKDDVYTKTTSYAHTEFNHFSKEHYDYVIKNLKDPFGRQDTVFSGLEPIQNLPIYVQQNKEKFKKYILTENIK
jgi:beta-1,4-mannosyl-glycoprotein beta-1,4-N-acetylglucosaminyltransferase